MRCALTFLLCIGFPTLSMAIEPIGRTVAVTDTVTGNSSGSALALKVSTNVFMDERLSANSSGNAQIQLKDGTKVVVGPDADIVLDSYTYNAKAGVGEIAFKATKGAFRFISGTGRSHEKYKVVTPYATIGVRGTAFDVTIEKGGTYVALLSGAVDICGRNGKCIALEQPCDYAFVGTGRTSERSRLSELGRNKQADIFPLLARQQHLRPDFRRYAASCSPTVTVTSAQERTAAIAPPAPVAEVTEDGHPNQTGQGHQSHGNGHGYGHGRD
ncbi:MAG: FecR domain-containing protein [Rhizobiaceae bacterium]